jgi:hypothetical protein
MRCVIKCGQAASYLLVCICLYSCISLLLFIAVKCLLLYVVVYCCLLLYVAVCCCMLLFVEC